MMKLRLNKTQNESRNTKEIPTSDFLPFATHFDEYTILTKTKELIRIIKVEGFSFETADDEDVDMRKELRNQLFKGMGSGSYALHFHIMRRRQSVFGDENIPVDPALKQKHDFVSRLEEAWREKHMKHESFINELYISIVRKADTKGAAIVEHLYKKLKQTASKTEWEKDIVESLDELDEVTTRIMTQLRDYDVRLLKTVYDEDGNACSELMSFFGKIVNCLYSSKYRIPKTSIDKSIPLCRIFLGHKSIEVRHPTKSRFAGIISIKEYCPSTHAGILDHFLQMPFEFVISQSFIFSNRQIAISKMQIIQNRMIQSEDKAVSQVVEISTALDMAMSGAIHFGEHNMTIMCVEDSLKSLENSLSMAVVELSNSGINAVREKVNMEAAFWSQLPGNIDYVARKSIINTLNLAAFASLHNYPVGKSRDNHWGEAVTVFDTTSGTPFFFNFHVKDVGHSLIIGPTGAGKTVLMNFLVAQSQKFKCRTYFFDKDRGAELFIRAIGGIYTIINPGLRCNFNPLQMDDTPTNRSFLMDWFKLLVTVNNEPIATEDISAISFAINGNYKLAKKDRILRNIAPFFGIETKGSIATRLSMWYGAGSHANVFDNDTDNIDLHRSKVFGFEMGELLRDKICLAPVLTYIFHRINTSLDGTPTMIVLDEAWALIDNPVFAPKIKDWLKVLRKLNAFVVFATQSVEDASKSQISDTLIQQTATQIFLPNLKATSIYREVFMLTNREFTLIRTTNPISRYFLVKQNMGAVVARIDLSGMQDFIHILSGRAETVLLLDQIREEVGDSPDAWIPVFLERVNQIE